MRATRTGCFGEVRECCRQNNIQNNPRQGKLARLLHALTGLEDLERHNQGGRKALLLINFYFKGSKAAGATKSSPNGAISNGRVFIRAPAQHDDASRIFRPVAGNKGPTVLRARVPWGVAAGTCRRGSATHQAAKRPPSVIPAASRKRNVRITGGLRKSGPADFAAWTRLFLPSLIRSPSRRMGLFFLFFRRAIGPENLRSRPSERVLYCPPPWAMRVGRKIPWCGATRRP